MGAGLHVTLVPPQHGWIEIRLKAPDGGFTAAVSNVPYSESLHDLVTGIRALWAGSPELTLRWNTEPTEYDFRFEAQGDDDVVLNV